MSWGHILGNYIHFLSSMETIDEYHIILSIEFLTKFEYHKRNYAKEASLGVFSIFFHI